jgi:hypothetical protein
MVEVGAVFDDGTDEGFVDVVKSSSRNSQF